MSSVKMIQMGLGAMGRGILKAIKDKNSIVCIGAVGLEEGQVGKDLGEIVGIKETGVIVNNSIKEILEEKKADVLVHATVSKIEHVLEQITPAIKAGVNVITLSEETAYPWEQHPQIAIEMDELAKEYGVSVLGTGLNPGFMMDLLPVIFSRCCRDVKSIKATRVSDFSKYGITALKQIGAGLTLSEYNDAVEKGEVWCHVGLLESVGLIAKGLHWNIDSISETKEPVLSKSLRHTIIGPIEPGNVCGFKQDAYGKQGAHTVIILELTGIVKPSFNEDNVVAEATIDIEGDPGVSVVVKGGIQLDGGAGTIANVVNVIPYLVKASPGLVTVLDLPAMGCVD